ncbi:MAG: cytochrome b/b6 domain-containing protein [Verrucomicrobiales bacterium]|nr:cytochrome b/b6 domain-containing protein [Verrucomicrobiales bacterium]
MERAFKSRRILVWDWPIRVFHAAFGFAVVAAMAISLLVDDDSPAFRWHMLFGLGAVSLLAARLVLGLFGSRTARFSAFPIQPSALKRYAIEVLRGTGRTYAGRNPGSAAAAVLMFLLVPALAMTGLGWGGGETEDLHGALAYSLMAVVGVHLAGLALHTWRYRENIGASMVTGRAEGPDGATGLASSRPWLGVAMAVFTALVAWWLITGFDSGAGTVRWPGMTSALRLGEAEHSEHEHGERRSHHDD